MAPISSRKTCRYESGLAHRIRLMDGQNYPDLTLHFTKIARPFGESHFIRTTQGVIRSSATIHVLDATKDLAHKAGRQEK
mmetsp:Transcript_27541/g.69208  ORF Transcript_27541/g.69208 Transcript_27541/m.69208 type:complete len:80 (-) Transcript_27541:509-748(-)